VPPRDAVGIEEDQVLPLRGQRPEVPDPGEPEAFALLMNVAQGVANATVAPALDSCCCLDLQTVRGNHHLEAPVGLLRQRPEHRL